LQGLTQGDTPLVRILAPRPGQKEKRCVQLLSGEPDLSEPSAAEARERGTPEPSRIEALESQLAALKAELSALREEFSAFRKQFE
jgi:uncharacterized protein YceH (UPF0502 family)